MVNILKGIFKRKEKSIFLERKVLIEKQYRILRINLIQPMVDLDFCTNENYYNREKLREIVFKSLYELGYKIKNNKTLIVLSYHIGINDDTLRFVIDIEY